MSTRTSLRRSRRAPKKQLSDYSVGDKVAIDRNGVKVEARLAQLLTEGSSVHPRWLVKFEGPYKDEEVYEHTFTLLEAALEPDAGSGNEGPLPTKESNINNNNALPSTSSSTNSSDPHAGAVAPAQPPKKTSSTGGAASGNTSPSEESSTAQETDNAKVSAREERSRRRQAAIDEFGVQLHQLGGTTVSATGKRKIGNGGGGGRNNKKQRSRDGDQECLKIKLLTGTLYLYRGKHRRAEFVRRV